MTPLARVLSGRIDPPEPTHEAADALWCRLAAEGAILDRIDDGERDRAYRVNATLLTHPDLGAGECYALFAMGSGTLTVYRCAVDDARVAVRDCGAFNL